MEQKRANAKNFTKYIIINLHPMLASDTKSVLILASKFHLKGEWHYAPGGVAPIIVPMSTYLPKSTT